MSETVAAPRVLIMGVGNTCCATKALAWLP